MVNLAFIPMKIALGADHAGFLLKEELRKRLQVSGHSVRDFGTFSANSTDYPDYAEAVSREVAIGNSDRGILVCFTGTGMCIAANKVVGIRAAVALNEEAVQLTRKHNDANVLTLGARFVEANFAEQLIRLFLDTQFEGGRHSRRVDKISAIEQMAHQEPVIYS